MYLWLSIECIFSCIASEPIDLLAVLWWQKLVAGNGGGDKGPCDLILGAKECGLSNTFEID